MLAGGTGGARLAAAMQSLNPAPDLTVVANTADDDEFWGLQVSPDLDAVIYRLAGMFNEEAGYGVKDDSFYVLEALARAGEGSWFQIGDKDFATHLIRSEMLRRGRTPTEAAAALCRRYGVAVSVLPMTDGRVRTRFVTTNGELSFQEYFVRDRLQPALRAIEFAGIKAAQPTPEVVDALAEADIVIIGPSNPLISIAPILKVIGSHVPRDRTVAITPIVGGRSLKGPTVEMMRAIGPEPTPVAVGRMYRDIAAGFVLDSRDQELAPQLEDLGYRTLTCDTVMSDGGGGLATKVLEAFM